MELVNAYTERFFEEKAVRRTYLFFELIEKLEKCNDTISGEKDTMLQEVLEERTGSSSTYHQGRNAAAPEPRHTVDRAPRVVSWPTYVPGTGSGDEQNVLPATHEFVNSKLQGISHNTIFRLTSAKKGKACIICISNFLVQSLKPLDGYTVDRQKLARMWFQMGYEVLIPECTAGNWHLTVEEIRNVVREFSHKLQPVDESAVLCILSHGGEGYIYGSDGKIVSLQLLLKQLDNEQCPAMKKKPKVVVVQACAGGDIDYGQPAGPSSGTPVAYSAANEPPLPTMSDFIICSASLPGNQSYVRGRGSVFIEHFINIFTSHAKDDDIQTMMTWVNRLISEEDIAVEQRRNQCKQMSHADTCLTKLLYFFPCRGGQNGQDWCPDTHIVHL